MKHSTLILGILFVFSLTSCHTELTLAKAYVNERTGIQAAVYFPEKADMKLENNATYGQTAVLKDFNQDLFLDIMYGAYTDAMKAYNVNVYIPDNIDNVKTDSLHWLVMLSRMEITGQITEYDDYYFSATDEYSYKHPLNTVNVASWFELNDGEWKPLQFCEHNLIDGLNSKANYSLWTDKIDYEYTIDTLKLNDVYNYAVYLGKVYAGYTYDYMMNDYVNAELQKRHAWYQVLLRYDPYKKTFYFAEENDGFIQMD